MHILLVDDDADDQALFGEAIRTIDPFISCDFSNDGEEALDKLSASLTLPDVIFLDINMPRMDGRTCLRRIRSMMKLSDLPVVVISTYVSPKDAILFQMLGADFMTKPDNFKTLINHLHHHLFSALQSKHELNDQE